LLAPFWQGPEIFLYFAVSAATIKPGRLTQLNASLALDRAG